MGCDIHLKVERRVNGKWECVESLSPRPCSWCDGAGHYKNRPLDKCYSCSGSGAQSGPYRDRNYTVFSVLAGVRNDGYVKPIATPRGLPDGIADDGEYGDHSFSWLTLAELRAYDWHQSIHDEGWVDAETFKKWDAAGAKGNPEQWCGAVGGGAVEHVTHSRMREYIADGMKESPVIERIAGKRSFYTLIQWDVPLTDYCKHFLSFLETLSAIGADEDVRIVFGFDS
jgi:hypothetical protein